MTPENQRDEDLKRFMLFQGDSSELCPAKMDECLDGYWIKYDDFIAQRQSWEREKAVLEDKLSHALYQSESWMKSNAGQCARADKAEAEKKGLEEQVRLLCCKNECTKTVHVEGCIINTNSRLEERVRELTTENEGYPGIAKDLEDSKETIDRLTAALGAAHEALKQVDDLINESRGVVGLHLNGDEASWDWLYQDWLSDLPDALADPTGHLAFEKWKALQNTKQEYDKAMNVCLDKFSNQKFGSVADCLNGIFEKWKKMEAVVEAAREVATYVQCLDYNSSERMAVDDLKNALEALDAKGGVSE